MRRIKSVLAVVAAMVTMMALAGPAFASSDGGCIAAVPTSPLSAVTVAVTSLPLLHLLQIAAALYSRGHCTGDFLTSINLE